MIHSNIEPPHVYLTVMGESRIKS